MAKTKISEYDATAANNTDIDSISIAEGMAPSNVNNSIRAILSHLKKMDVGTDALTSPQLTSVDINGGTIDGAVIGANSAAAITGTTITGTSLVIGSANINENDFESIDGITAGTVAASKAVIVDTNKDITGFRNVTLTGELDAGSLDISGDIDVDGTTNLDVVDIDGAVDMASTLQVDGAITSSAGATITTADNTTQLTLISTDADASKGPMLDLYRNSGSPAANDDLGRINFQGENDADETITYSQIFSEIVAAGDGVESGRYKIGTMVAGAFKSRMDMTATETVFNDESIDVDFRVESNGNANMLFVDGGNNAVVVGQSAPDTTISGGTPAFQVIGTGVAASASITRREANQYGPTLFLTKSRNTAVGSNTIVNNGDALGVIAFIGDDGTNLDTYGATITASVDATPGANDMPTRLSFSVTADGASSPSERMRIDSSGNVGIGTASPDAIFTVDSNVGGSSTGTIARFHSSKGESDSTYLQIAATRHGTASVQRVQLQAFDNDGSTGRTLALNPSGGNVGIGTNDPDCMLHLSGGNEQAKIKFQVGTANADKFKIYASTAGRLYVNSDNGSTGVYLTHNGTSWTSNSDETLKDNISSLGTVGDKLKNYRTSYFNWKADTDTPPKRNIGFIAQDWETDFPEVVTKKEGETLGMQYTETIPILLKYIQELEARITALEG